MMTAMPMTLAIAAIAASPDRATRFPPPHAVTTPLACKLALGAATAAPPGTDLGMVQQILVMSSDPATLTGTRIDVNVRLANATFNVRHIDNPPPLRPGAWLTVGEMTRGRYCSATLTRLVPSARRP